MPKKKTSINTEELETTAPLCHSEARIKWGTSEETARTIKEYMKSMEMKE